MATRVDQPETTDEFLRAIGDPQKAALEIQQAQASGRVLSSEHPHLIDQYLDRWVALHDGNVVASAGSVDDLLRQIEPETRSHVLVRFIARNEQKLIL